MTTARLSLRSSMPLSITTAMPYGHVVERINRLVAHNTRRLGDQREGLAGFAVGDEVVLYLTYLAFRRGRSWAVEFRGTLRPVAAGTELAGSFTIKAAKLVRAFQWLWRMGVLAFVGFGTVATLALHNDYSVRAFVVVFVSLVVIGLPFIGASMLIEWWGNGQATRDAETIERMLRERLTAPPPS
jgi:hypothetical protein